MSLISTLQDTDTKTLFRALNSTKDYLFFDISVFNAGAAINIKCTNSFKEINQNTWNGYDFIIENDSTTKYYIQNVLSERLQMWIKNNNFDPKTQEQQKEFDKICKQWKSLFPYTK